ncbi:multiheme c-type cytochrome [Catenovulum adriaticum]|uniref:Multiheme c-type cytochrome n=1 Tax=Catenovulum adriaticum TaxID=2984846 RepID=A0ABY7ALR5_9ALTE|nr:multiheme c-type cytochrome [Catenovulum sp. TS8]WAJ70163.1 multiheme c-type cytochrome [Catenovulum sp. TS8]
MKAANLLKESKFLAICFGLLMISSLSAIYSYLAQVLSFDAFSFIQIANLVHLTSSILLSVIMLPYCYYHIKRIIGVRRFAVFSSGLVSLLLIFSVIYTGLILAYQGVTEQNQTVLNWHIILSLTAISLLVLHLICHYFSFVASRHAGVFKTISGLRVQLFYQTCAVAIFCLLIGLLATSTEQAYSTQPIVDNYQYNYGDHPFRPSQTETPQQMFIDEKALLTTDKCATCHADIAQQWYASAHRQAASDKTYETNVKLLASNKGIEATRYCEGCHAPVALLTGQLTQGGIHGGIDDSPANIEGVNCQSCHGITQLVHTKGVASYQFEINQAYLFETATNPWLQNINKLLIKQNPTQHKQDMAAPVLATAEYCASCHAQFIDKDLNDWGWVKMQDEYSAWLESPFSGNHDSQFAHKKQQRCQDCHMPLVAANDPSADHNGQVRDHRFLAANTMLPLLAKDEDFLNATIDFLRKDKVRISIEPPHRKSATSNLMPLDETVRASAIQPYYFYKGEKAKINIIVANTGVGHNFPGGSIDINQVWVNFEVTDAQGELVYQSGYLDNEGYLDKKAYQYRSLPVDRNGDIVWKHDLFNMVGKASVNVIKAGQSDVIEYQFNLPYWIKSPLYVSAKVQYRKLNTRYAKWALQDEYQPLPIIDMARSHLTIPVRDKLEAIDNAITLAD